MEKLVEVTKNMKVFIDEKHGEFEFYIKEYSDYPVSDNNTSPLQNMIYDAINHDFSGIDIIEKGILKLIKNSEWKEVEIYG